MTTGQKYHFRYTRFLRVNLQLFEEEIYHTNKFNCLNYTIILFSSNKVTLYLPIYVSSCLYIIIIYFKGDIFIFSLFVKIKGEKKQKQKKIQSSIFKNESFSKKIFFSNTDIISSHLD